VDAERTIYGQIPMRGQLGSAATFQQERVAPILVDTRAKTLQFALAAPLTTAALARLLGRPALPREPIDGLELALPGVTLQARRAVVEAAGQGLLVKLAR